jgi:hypothetical protein
VAKRAAPIALTIPEHVALHIGRGVLIALPALGGIFALYLMKTDRKRATLERSTGSRLSFMLFGGAAVTTDAVDAVCHFVIAYGVLRELGHHFLAHVGGQLGFVSMLCAVLGEVVAYRRHKKSSINNVNGQSPLPQSAKEDPPPPPPPPPWKECC